MFILASVVISISVASGIFSELCGAFIDFPLDGLLNLAFFYLWDFDALILLLLLNDLLIRDILALFNLMMIHLLLLLLLLGLWLIFDGAIVRMGSLVVVFL